MKFRVSMFLLIITIHLFAVSLSSNDAKFLTIDKSNTYQLRIYFFTDMSSCEICNQNIPIIINSLKNYKIENVVFLKSINQKSAEKFLEDSKIEAKAIADEYGVYFDKFSINFTPTVLILSNDGFLKYSAKLGSDKHLLNNIVELLDGMSASIQSTNSKIKEISRMNVTIDTNNLIGGFYNRDLLYDNKRDCYYLRNDKKHNLYIIDGKGKLVKSLNNRTHHEFYGYNSTDRLCWMIKDSILLLGGTYYPFNRFVQYYDVDKDSVYPHISRREYDYIVQNCSGDTIAYSDFSSLYASGDGKYYYGSLNSNKKERLNADNSTLFLYDNNGNLIKSANSPDSIYIKYSNANWFCERFTGTNNGQIFTFQGFTNILNVWDSELNHIKSVPIDMSNLYKVPNFDIPAYYRDVELTRKIENSISRLNRNILIDDTKNLILFSFQNTNMPEGVGDYTHSDVEYTTIIILTDIDGNRLHSEPIVLKNKVIPFYFNDKMIMTSELTQNRELQIVRYELN